MNGLAVLSILNWFHLVGTVIWMGGIIINNFAIVPTASKNLEPPIMGRFMMSYIKRFRVLSYISMGILVITGVIMTIMNPNYGNTTVGGILWSQFTLVKHIFVAILIIIAIYLFQVLNPKLEQLSAKGPSPETANIQKQLMGWGITSLVIAFINLVFTAIQGAISVLS